VIARAKNGLTAAKSCSEGHVGGTAITALMAASLASGKSVIENAAREPEIKTSPIA